MIKRTMGKNSNSNKKRIHEVFTKVKIKNKIEKTGFFAKIIEREAKTQKIENIKKKK